jgi:hypothetical protein
MTCPRCGQQLPPVSVSRCPSCGQPLYAPAKHPSRITKLAPLSTLPPIPEQAPSPVPLDEDSAWPDLTVPRLRESEASWSEPAGGAFPPPTRPSTWLLMPPPREIPRQLVGIIVAAALILILISGGTLVLVNSLRHHSTASHAQTPNTALGSNGTAAGVPTKVSGLPTATTAPKSPTGQPTAGPTAAPHLVTIFQDPLTSNADGWPVTNGCSFAGGGYTVSAGARCVAPITAQPDTVNISVQMTGTPSNSQGAGIGFRIPSVGDNQYDFLISSQGTCTAADGVTDATLFNNTSCSAIALGQTAVNTLTINQSGAHMDFYVNGTLVGSANDGTLSTGGIALEVHGHGTSAVVFNNFVLTTLQ